MSQLSSVCPFPPPTLLHLLPGTYPSIVPTTEHTKRDNCCLKLTDRLGSLQKASLFPAGHYICGYRFQQRGQHSPSLLAQRRSVPHSLQTGRHVCFCNVPTTYQQTVFLLFAINQLPNMEFALGSGSALNWMASQSDMLRKMVGGDRTQPAMTVSSSSSRRWQPVEARMPREMIQGYFLYD